MGGCLGKVGGGVWAEIEGYLGKERGGLGKDWVASAGPYTSSGGDCKAPQRSSGGRG